MGVLETTALTQNIENFQAFRKGMEERRYVEGRSLETCTAAEGRTERFAELAMELVRAHVDLLVTRGTPATQAARRATATIPIVRAAVAVSYGVNYPDLYYRAAGFADRILKGAEPGELAIERPSKFMFYLNRRAVHALKLLIPPDLFLKSDRVVD